MKSATIGERLNGDVLEAPRHEWTETTDIDALLADIGSAAGESLRESDVELLRDAIVIDHLAWHELEPGAHRSPRVVVRAADGAELRDVLRVLIAAIRSGARIDVSLGWPLSDRLHRALLRAGAQVRVESLRTWGCRVRHDGDHIRVVGPRRSRSTALRRAMPGPQEWAAGADATAVDLDGAGELERLVLRSRMQTAV